MHSDKKYLVMTGADNEFEMVTSQTTAMIPSETIGSLAATLTPTPNDFSRSSTNVWMNTMPMSTSSNTLGKRSNRSKRVVNVNVLTKDYIKKRNLILELLAVEIQMLLVSSNKYNIWKLNSKYHFVFC
jgi:phosphatidylinositol 4-kinase